MPNSHLLVDAQRTIAQADEALSRVVEGQPQARPPAGSTAASHEAISGAVWMSPKEYAAYKGVHPETVKRWCRAGLLKAERCGKLGHWRIPREQAA